MCHVKVEFAVFYMFFLEDWKLFYIGLWFEFVLFSYCILNPFYLRCIDRSDPADLGHVRLRD